MSHIKTKRPQTTALHNPMLPDGVDISWHYARARAVGEAPHLRDAASNSDNLGNLKHPIGKLVVWVGGLGLGVHLSNNS